MNLFNKLRDWWRRINACETCGKRPAVACGDCRECIDEYFQTDQWAVKKIQKLEAALEKIKNQPNCYHMNNLDLTHLETLLAAATPGPWAADYNCTTFLYSTEFEVGRIESGQDADLIVALRNAAPALIARVRELEQTVSEQELTIHELKNGDDA